MTQDIRHDRDNGADDTARFLDQCRPKLEELEAIRLEKLKVFKRRKKLALPIGAVLTPIFGFIDYWLLALQSGDDPAAGLSVLVLGGLWGWVTSPKRQYATAYKKDILPDIASLFGNFSYDVKGKIPMKVMKPSKIVPGYSSYSSEDLFSGEYNNVGIQFSEIKLRKKSGKTTRTVFDGLAVLLTSGTRKFYGHTILTRDQGKLGSWMTKQFSGLERANLVDPEFEKLFDVHTTDQVEARYLIDPMIVENLKDLYKEYRGTQMMAAFYDDHVLILIGSNDNHFEPASIETPATDSEGLLTMKREIDQILSIIDRLALIDKRKQREAKAQRTSQQSMAS